MPIEFTNDDCDSNRSICRRLPFNLHCDYSDRYSISKFLNFHRITSVVTRIFRYFHALLAIYRCPNATHMYVIIFLVHCRCKHNDRYRYLRRLFLAFYACSVYGSASAHGSPSVRRFACLSGIAGKQTADNGRNSRSKRNDNAVCGRLAFCFVLLGGGGTTVSNWFFFHGYTDKTRIY